MAIARVPIVALLSSPRKPSVRPTPMLEAPDGDSAKRIPALRAKRRIEVMNGLEIIEAAINRASGVSVSRRESKEEWIRTLEEARELIDAQISAAEETHCGA